MPNQQYRLMYQAQKRLSAFDRHFMMMITDSTNPLTNDDLSRLVERRPSVWGRYKKFIGKLKDGPDPKVNIR